MRGLRRCVRVVAGAWLLLQLSMTAGVPVVLYASTSHEAEECTCEHPAGGVCPMHRHSSKSSSTSGGCSLRAAFDPLEALVASLIGPTGVLSGLVAAIIPIETSEPLEFVESAPLNRLIPPDSPPPRA